MKNLLTKILLAFFANILIFSCEEREKITIDNGNAAVLSDMSSKQLFLDQNFQANPALTINWTPAEYSVPTSVTYKLEVSSTESFSSPYPMGTLTLADRPKVYNVKEVNEAAKAIGLLPDVAAKMYVRISSYVGADYLNSVSNITYVTVTPYKVVYPTFYIVGAASYVGWTATAAQDLYKDEQYSTIYTYLEKDQNFRFLGQQDWNPINYALNADGTKDANKYFKTWNTTFFSKPDGDDENIKFIGTTGIYKMTIDASPDKKTLDLKASAIAIFDVPTLYIVGNIAGIAWSADNAKEMTRTGPGVFEFTTTLPADAEFKFLGQKSFGTLDWGNISKKGDSGFIGPKDDNGNIAFVGDGSSYKITVNIKAGTYKIVKQ